MKTINLTQRKVAIVDDDDFEKSNKYKWFYNRQGSHGYAYRKVVIKDKERKTYSLHRFILGLWFDDKRQVDHINGNTLDNRKENLRICFPKENNRNKRLSKNNTSGFKGVCWNKMVKKWEVAIRVDYKLKRLGYFNNKIKAAIAYNKAAQKYFGEFSHLNEI